MLATYGLRPHELWHVTGIDEKGWLTVPGGPDANDAGQALLTKTRTHHVTPVPAEWVEDFQLKKNFEKYQSELRNRWEIQWGVVKNEGQANEITVPVNNDDLGHYLYKQFTMRGTQQLFCDLKVGKGRD